MLMLAENVKEKFKMYILVLLKKMHNLFDVLQKNCL